LAVTAKASSNPPTASKWAADTANSARHGGRFAAPAQQIEVAGRIAAFVPEGVIGDPADPQQHAGSWTVPSG